MPVTRENGGAQPVVELRSGVSTDVGLPPTALVAAALAAGGQDDATAVVVDVVGLPEGDRAWRPHGAREARGEVGGTAVTTTNAAVRSYRRGAGVMDRGSTNGSILVRAGVSRELSAGRPATLHDGDRVLFGDREMRVSREQA